MTNGQTFAKYLPTKSYVQTKCRYVARIYFFRQNERGKIGFEKKVSMLGSKLDCIPKKRIVPDKEGRSNDNENENEVGFPQLNFFKVG